MPIRSDCPHCNEEKSVFPVGDPAGFLKKEIFVCLHSNWWGDTRDKIAYPLPPKASVKLLFSLEGKKCLLCGSEHIDDTGSDEYPFGCYECGAWGEHPGDISNPEPSEDDWRHGQVPKRPTE